MSQLKSLKKTIITQIQKSINLIKSLEDKKFKKATLGGCIFIKKDLLCLKKEEKSIIFYEIDIFVLFTT